MYQDRYVRSGGVWRIAVRAVERSFDLQPLPASYGIARVAVPE